MTNLEKQLNELKEGLEQSSMSDRAQAGIEQRLRLVWQQNNAQAPTMTNTKKSWKDRLVFIMPLGLSGAAISFLAIVTTVTLSPSNLIDLESPTSNLSEEGYAISDDSSQLVTQPLGDADVSHSKTAGLLAQDSARKANGRELSDAALMMEPMPPATIGTNSKDNLSFGEGEQLFDESVSLGIETRQSITELITNLRTEISNLDGYLVGINYNKASGATINLQLPAEKLTTFESYLKELDRNNSLEVSAYSVENISEQVVVIEEAVKNAEEQVADWQAQLESTDQQLTFEQRTDLQSKVDEQSSYISSKQGERDELIATYGLIDVKLTVTEWVSLWQGHYWQYDDDTLGGAFKYNLAKVIYRLIHSGGSLVRFGIWLLIYAVLLTPVMIVCRRLYRSYRLRHPATPKPPVA